MLFDILPLKNNTARLIRVYGDEPCIAVPGEVPGPGGEKWTLTELGDYCFLKSSGICPPPMPSAGTKSAGTGR